MAQRDSVLAGGQQFRKAAKSSGSNAWVALSCQFSAPICAEAVSPGREKRAIPPPPREDLRWVQKRDA